MLTPSPATFPYISCGYSIFPYKYAIFQPDVADDLLALLLSSLVVPYSSLGLGTGCVEVCPGFFSLTGHTLY
jgi:hypothetical protein